MKYSVPHRKSDRTLGSGSEQSSLRIMLYIYIQYFPHSISIMDATCTTLKSFEILYCDSETGAILVLLKNSFHQNNVQIQLTSNTSKGISQEGIGGVLT